jgi:hypothetical protein
MRFEGRRCARDQHHCGSKANHFDSMIGGKSRPSNVYPLPSPSVGLYRTCSTARLPAGNGFSSSASGLLRSSQAFQSARSNTTICRLWIGATSGPGSVVRRVKASPLTPSPSRHSPAKQNHSSLGLVNCHFDFGDFAPVNSKKWLAGMRHRPFGKRRFSERKLMTAGAFGRAAGKPHLSCANSLCSPTRRITGAVSVGQMSLRGSRFGAICGNRTGCEAR